jgi:hypothetical protein
MRPSFNGAPPQRPAYSLQAWTSLPVVVYLSIAIWGALKEMGWSFHFYAERGAVTALSEVLLAWAAAFAYVTATRTGGTGLDRSFWYLAAAGIAFLAIDELVGSTRPLATPRPVSTPPGSGS